MGCTAARRVGHQCLGLRQAQLAGDQAGEQGVAEGGERLGLLLVDKNPRLNRARNTGKRSECLSVWFSHKQALHVRHSHMPEPGCLLVPCQLSEHWAKLSQQLKHKCAVGVCVWQNTEDVLVQPSRLVGPYECVDRCVWIPRPRKQDVAGLDQVLLITTVRLKVEQNQLLSVVGLFGCGLIGLEGA